MATTEIIKSASIARVTRKSDGKFLGWGVKSNSSNEYYEVHCTKIADECVWSCSCKAGQMNFSGCKDGKCCHVKAVIEVSQARKEMASAPVATVEAPRLSDAAFIAQVKVWHEENLHQKFEAKVAKGRAAKQAKEITCKRAPQFAGMELTGRGFVVASIEELNWRLVPLKVA